MHFLSFVLEKILDVCSRHFIMLNDGHAHAMLLQYLRGKDGYEWAFLALGS